MAHAISRAASPAQRRWTALPRAGRRVRLGFSVADTVWLADAAA